MLVSAYTYLKLFNVLGRIMILSRIIAPPFFTGAEPRDLSIYAPDLEMPSLEIPTPREIVGDTWLKHSSSCLSSSQTFRCHGHSWNNIEFYFVFCTTEKVAYLHNVIVEIKALQILSR